MLNYLIADTNWDVIFHCCTSIDDMLSRFLCVIHSYFALTVPLSTRKITFDRYPSHIKRLFHHREALFAKCRAGTRVNLLFEKACSDLSREVKKFDRSVQNKAYKTKHSRDLFQYIRSRCNPAKQLPAIFRSDSGASFSDPKSIATAFASLFSSVYIADDNVIPFTKKIIRCWIALMFAFFPILLRKRYCN